VYIDEGGTYYETLTVLRSLDSYGLGSPPYQLSYLESSPSYVAGGRCDWKRPVVRLKELVEAGSMDTACCYVDTTVAGPWHDDVRETIAFVRSLNARVRRPRGSSAIHAAMERNLDKVIDTTF
jgi:hypothetical protein